jgi:hypothetical protein
MRDIRFEYFKNVMHDGLGIEMFIDIGCIL